MFVAASLAILVSMGLALARALLGPTTYDRIAAVNMFGTKTVLLIGVLAFFSDRTDLLDIALVYALINFIGAKPNRESRSDYRYCQLGSAIGWRRSGHRWRHRDSSLPRLL